MTHDLRMPTYRDHGLVLKSRAVRDADRHFTVFTRDHGKVQLLAKGSRRGRSKMSGHLTGFGVVDVMVARGRLADHLAGVELIEAAPAVFGSLAKAALVQGAFLTADAFTRRDQPDERLFVLLRDFLFAVDALPEPTASDRILLLGGFAAKLTALLGFGLEIGECVRCRQPLSPHGNALNVVRGGAECRSCRDGLAPSVTPEAIKALRYLREAPVAEAVRLVAPAPVLRELNFLTELQLAAHLEGHLPALRYLQAVA